MSSGREIRKGFQEEGLSREEGMWEHCRAFGGQRSSELLGWDMGGEILGARRGRGPSPGAWL